ncbi:hypothetical protein DRN97_00140 [Methanosarcinales archaeon]|nr:MAG: hypothetical protein DRN97_00140 [Methanosarcinales archaeon]
MWKMELFKVEKMKIKKITDTTTKREEKEEAQRRTISFESEDVSVTLKGKPWVLTDFSVGDIVDVHISKSKE